MYELANRTDEAMEMITTVTTHLSEMEDNIKKRHNGVIEVVNYLELTDDALQLYDLLMIMMLEDRMEAVVYMQDLVDQSYAFRRGVQALLQGKITIDLVPPTLVSSETEGQLICGSKPPVKTRIENYAKLAIGCDCAFQTVGAWIPYSLRACQSRVAGAKVRYPSNWLIKARMHVKTWRGNIIKGGKVTIEMTEDPFPPELRNQFADMAKDSAVRVPMTDLMKRIKSHDEARRRKIAAINRRWSFTRSPSGWPVFTGISTFIIILAIGYLIYRCCKTVPQSPINMALGGLIPRGAAQEIGQVAARVRNLDMTEEEHQGCPTSGTEATTAAVLAIVLLLLILAVAVLIWKK